ncbi:MAG: CHAT domain-containing protein [Planctomycetes bacterium]|nr:CHAT domain-containing protein [Planctomycetota bacterium]
MHDLQQRLPAAAAGELGPELRRLVREVTGHEAMPVAERRVLLHKMAALVPVADEQSTCFLAQARAVLADRDGDRGEAIQLCAVAASATGEKVQTVRRAALQYLLPACIASDHIAIAWTFLDADAEVVDATEAAATRAELLLRVGMLRPAAAAVQALTDIAGESVRCRCLRMEELLATEQYEAALVVAAAIEQEPAAAPDDRDRAAIGWAFAATRLGRTAAAEQRLVDLLARPIAAQAPSDHRVRARADLALLRLREGRSLPAIRALLSPELVLPYDRLPSWSLVARARLELAEGLAVSALVELRDVLAARFRFAIEQWRALPELSAGVAFLQLSVRRDLLAVLCLAEVRIGEGAVDRCLQHALVADACGSMARRHDLPVAEVETVRRVGVPPGGRLLWFVPAPSGSVALVVGTDGGTVVPLPPDLALRDRVRALRALVVDERQAGADWRQSIAAATAPLAEWLLPPQLWREIGSVRRWTVLGRELLTGLPFEFLPFSASGDRLIGHAVAIDYVPSATLMAAAAQRPPNSATAGLAVVAAGELDVDGKRDAACEPLVIGEGELAAVAANVAPSHVIARDRTTSSDLLELAGRHRMVIVFAHGHHRRGPAPAAGATLAADRPIGITLRDGFFGANRLAEQTIAAELVVLAACGTARAGVDRGEDAQLFGTAWLAAGARGVLATDGDLELVATQRLLQVFVRGCASGLEAAEALRQARVELAADPAFAHPSLHCLLRLDRTIAGVITLPAQPAARGWSWSVSVVAGVLIVLGSCNLVRRRRPVAGQPEPS